jgi:RNA polymerase sigma-70 factor (ECF subfamily)
MRRIHDHLVSDKELVYDVVVRNQFNGFAELYDRYHEKVYNKCLVFVNTEEDAKDLTHDIFLKAYINLRKLDGDETFAGWFYGLAYGMCLQYARARLQQNRTNRWEFDEIEEQRIKVFHCDSENRLLSLSVDELRRVLSKLPPQDRLLLLMKYQDQMTVNEMQLQLQISIEQIKTHLDRARERAIAIYDKLINQYTTYDEFKSSKPFSTTRREPTTST